MTKAELKLKLKGMANYYENRAYNNLEFSEMYGTQGNVEKEAEFAHAHMYWLGKWALTIDILKLLEEMDEAPQ